MDSLQGLTAKGSRRSRDARSRQPMDSLQGLTAKGSHRSGDRYLYELIGSHAHTRLRSPYGLSTRPTLGQNLKSRSHGAG